MLADTGNPFAVVLGQADLVKLMQAELRGVNTNFGTMTGGWIQLAMPEFGLTRRVSDFDSDRVLQAVRADSSDFLGLIGLPLLRMLEYGGDHAAFWIRRRKRTTQLSPRRWNT